MMRSINCLKRWLVESHSGPVTCVVTIAQAREKLIRSEKKKLLNKLKESG